MKEGNSSYFESNEFMELLDKYENMERNGSSCYFDGFDISNLAEYYSTIDDMDKANDVIRYGLSLHPNDPDIMIAKGQVLVRQGKTIEARMIAGKIDLTNDRELLFLKGNIELADGNPSLADLYFEQAAETDEEDIGFYTDVINLFTDNGQYALAQKWLDKALLLEPELKDLTEQQADLFFVTQELDKAEEVYNRLIDESPYDAYYWEQLTCIAYRRQDYPKALECLEFLEAVDPFNDSLASLKAECLMQTEQYVKAEKLLRNLIVKIPDSSDYLFMLADVLSMQEKHEESVDYLTKAIELEEDDPRLYVLLSGELYECGRFKEAAKSLTTAFGYDGKIEPEFVNSLLKRLVSEHEYELAYKMLEAFFKTVDIENEKEEIKAFCPLMSLLSWETGHTESLKKYFRISYLTDPGVAFSVFGIENSGMTYRQALNFILNNPPDGDKQL